MRLAAWPLFVCCLSLNLLGAFSTAALAQTTCTGYLNASDGLDTNNGRSPAQAVRSFEYAFGFFPSGCTIYMAAGEYFFTQDADGIQLRGPAVQDKHMTFVLQPFAGNQEVRFSEKEWVLDIGGGSVTFSSDGGTRLVFGVGQTNSPAAFGNNTNFLHTLALHTGTLDLRAVADVRFEESVGNPSFVLPGSNPVRQAPADAAIVRSNGTLLGTSTFVPAPRQVRYTGSTPIIAGAELPADIENGLLLFENTAGGTVTIPSALSVSGTGAVELRGTGDVRFTGTLSLQAMGNPPLRLATGSTGSLYLEGGLQGQIEAPSTRLFHHAGTGTLAVSSLTLRHARNNLTTDLPVQLSHDGPGTLSIASVTVQPNAGGRLPRPLLTSTAAGLVVLGQPANALQFSGNITNAAGGTIRLAGHVAIDGTLHNAGTVALQHFSLTLRSTEDYAQTGIITTAGPGTGRLVLDGPPSFQSDTPLPDLEVRKAVTLVTPAVQGNLTVTSGTLRLGAPLVVHGTFRQEADARFEFGTHMLDLRGNLVHAGGTIAPGQGLLRLASGGGQALQLSAPVAVRRLAVEGNGTRVALSGAALSVQQEAVVAQGAQLALGDQQLVLIGDGARVVNEGGITTGAGGAVVFADPIANAIRQRLGGHGTIGNVEIRLRTPTDRLLLDTPEVILSGSLTFQRGHLDLNGNTLTLADTLTLRRNLSGAPDGGFLITGNGRFNPGGIPYFLEYFGALTADRPLDPLPPADVVALRVSTSGTHALLLTDDLAFRGSLTIGPSSILELGDHTLTLTGSGVRHTVAGLVRASGSGKLLVTGSGTIDGGDSASGEATVEALWVETSGTLALSGLRRLGGSALPLDGLLVFSGTVDLALAEGTPAGGEGIVQFRQTGGTVRLSAPATITSLFQTTGGTFVLGEHDLVMGPGSRLESRAPARFEGDTTGAVVFASTGELRTGTNAIPHLRIATEGRVSLSGLATVSHRFTHERGTLDLNGFDLVLNGGTWAYEISEDGDFYGTSGALRIAGPVVAVLNGDPTVPNLRLLGTVPLPSLTLTSAAPEHRHHVRVRQSLLLDSGVLHLGLQDVVLLGTENALYVREGTVTATSLDPLADDANGEIVFGGTANMNVTLLGSAVLPNARIERNTFLPAGPFSLIITQRLVFGTGSLVLPAAGALVLEAGTQIVRRDEGVLTAAPHFTGPVDVYYATDGMDLGTDRTLFSGVELPDGPNLLRRLIVDAGRDATGNRNLVRLLKPIRVTDTLSLLSGDLDPGPSPIVLAPGATHRVDFRGSAEPRYAGAVSFSTEGPVNLVFANTSGMLRTTDRTFPAAAPVDLLRFEVQVPDNGAEPYLVLHADRTVDRLEIVGEHPDALLLPNGHTLTVRRHATLAGGTIYSPTPARIDVQGDLIVQDTTAFTGAAQPVVAGRSVLRSLLRTAVFETAGDVVLEAGGSLSDDCHVHFVGTEQKFEINTADDDPTRVDEVISALVVALDTAAAQPALHLVTNQSVPASLYAGRLVLRNGLLVTGANEIQVPGDAGRLERNVPPGKASHVVGTIGRTLPGADEGVTFPVGSGYPAAAYRPIHLAFAPDRQPSPTFVRVAHVDEAPAGTGGDNASLHGTAPFYWEMRTSPTIEPVSPVRVTMAGAGLDVDEASLSSYRILFHPATETAWRLLGTAASYTNRFSEDLQPPAPLIEVSGVAFPFAPEPLVLTIGTGDETQPVSAEPDGGLPQAFRLHGNYPNPFNPSTTLRFDLPEASEVHVEVFDLLGRRVLTTSPRSLPAGASRTLSLDAGTLASGAYLYRIEARAASRTWRETGRMVVLK